MPAPSRNAPLPTATIRDLIGITRQLYRHWQRNDVIVLESLRGIAEDFEEALRLARGTKPGSAAQRAAWTKAERATRDLCDLIPDYVSLKSVIETSGKYLGVSGSNVRLDERELKRLARQTRS